MAIDDLAVLPKFTGVAVHDGWTPYHQYTSAEHSLCNSHHIRELTAVTDRDASQSWANDLIEVLPDANRAAHRARDQGKTGTLLQRLDNRRDEVRRFAEDLAVPFTNNQAERDLRMAKLQMKISWTWRTTDDAETFAALRSYVSTVRKNGAGLLDSITELLNGKPWLPAT